MCIIDSVVTLYPEADFDEAYEALETIYTTTVIPARLFVD
jgi:hypothetical protein